LVRKGVMDERPVLPDRERLELVEEIVAGACVSVDETAFELAELRSAWDTIGELGCLTGTIDADDPPPASEVDAARMILFASFVQQAGEELVRAAERIMSDAHSLTNDDRFTGAPRQALVDWHRRQAQHYDRRR
jgi:hypothetical protein